MTGYGDALAAIRAHVGDLAADLDVWADRAVDAPDARARKYAAEAMASIDRALFRLHKVREVLIAEIRAADDASMARSEELLRRIRRDGGPPARA